MRLSGALLAHFLPPTGGAQNPIAMMTADWDATVPHGMGNSPTYCDKLKADLPSGTFVSWMSQNSDGCSEIGRIVGKTDDGNLKINVFVLLGDNRLPPTFQARPLLIDDTIKYIEEIVQTCEVLFVSPNAISDIVFVFPPKELQGRAYQGMRNLYLCRSREDNSDIGVFHSFPTHDPRYRYATCYAYRIWLALGRLRKELRKVLNRRTEKQGSYQSVPSGICLMRDEWEYILRYVDGVLHEPYIRTIKRVRCEMTAGITLHSYRDEEEQTFIRFETVQDLHHLCGLLGESSLTGVRKRRPAVSGNVTRDTLAVNDILNVIEGSTKREDPFRYRTCCCGIDFRFNGADELRFSVRYVRYQYKTAVRGNGVPIDGQAALKRLIMRADPGGNEYDGMTITNGSNCDSDDSEVIVDTAAQFEHDGRLYSVISVTNSEVDAECVFPPEHCGTIASGLDLDVVREAIKEYET